MGCTGCGPCGVVLTFLVLCLVTATNILSWFPQWKQFKVFNTTSGSVWDLYKLEVVQIDWIFYIHLLIYGIQFICLLYCSIASLCQSRCVKAQGQLFLQQPSVLVSYCLGLGGVVGWVAVRCMPTINAYSIISISAAAVCFCVSSLLSLRSSRNKKKTCVGLQGAFKPQSPGVILPEALVYNALLAMSTWTHALIMYTMAHLLQLYSNVQKDVAEYIAVGLIMAYLALWWSVDVFLTLSVSSLVVTPYLVTACLFAMSLVKNFNLQNLHFITSATFLCVSGLLLFLKLCAVCHTRCSHKFSSNDKYILHIEGRNRVPVINDTPNSNAPKPCASQERSLERGQSKIYTNGCATLTNGGLSNGLSLLATKTDEHTAGPLMPNSDKSINTSFTGNPIVKLPNGVQNGIQQRPKSLPLQFVLPQTTEELPDGFLTINNNTEGLGVTAAKATTLPRVPTTQNGDVPAQGVLVHRIRL